MRYRLIALWLFIVVSFVVASHFFELRGTTLTLWLPVAVFAVIFIALAGWMRRLNATVIEGGRFLFSGRYSQALERFTAALKTAPNNAAVKNNIALSQLYLWRVAQARDTLQLVSKNPKKLSGLLLGTESTHAMVLALLGEIGVAKEWLAIESSAPVEGQVALTHAIIDCREGRFEQALVHLQSFAVRHLGGFNAGLAQALTAWALENTAGRSRPIDRLLLFGESSPDGLSLIWPQLAQAVQRAPEL